MKKAEKPLYVENLAEEIKSATSVVLVDYTGLSVKMQQELKKRLKKVDASMTVVKNTLLKLALGKTPDTFDTPDTLDTLVAGPTALVITENDPIAPLQVLAKFAKEFDVPQLKVGIVEGSFQDKNALDKLAKLPGKNALFAQVVGSISAPLYSLTGTLQASMQNLISILEQAGHVASSK